MQTWVDQDLYSLDTPVDCGPITVEFFNDDLTAVDPAIFTKNADPSFVTQYQEDVALVGDYPILYRVTLTNYPANLIDSTVPFIISIVDPCDAPLSVTG